MKDFSLHHKVADIWEAQLRDIENATHSVLFEQYIIEDFEDGKIGQRFINALIKKAREGVEVRCILDAQGCFALFRNYELNNALEQAGGQIFYYKTLGATNIITPVRLFLRDHRKFLIIDHKITWIGGAVVGERFRAWNDLMGRFEDPCLADISSAEFRHQLLRLQEKSELLAPMQRVDDETHISGNAPGIGNRFTYEEISHAIMLAEESVTLVTPYFAPPLKLKRVINRRLMDGLKITLLVPKETDSWLADAAREAYFPRMLRNGLTLLYGPSAPEMTHAKIVIVDGKWITFGSTNLDALSLIFNHELNLVTRNQEVIQGVQKIVDEWTKGLSPVTEDTCRYKEFSWPVRFLGRCIRPIA